MSLKLTPGFKFTSVAKAQTVKKNQSKLVAFSVLIARLSPSKLIQT